MATDFDVCSGCDDCTMSALAGMINRPILRQSDRGFNAGCKPAIRPDHRFDFLFFDIAAERQLRAYSRPYFFEDPDL